MRFGLACCKNLRCTIRQAQRSACVRAKKRKILLVFNERIGGAYDQLKRQHALCRSVRGRVKNDPPTPFYGNGSSYWALASGEVVQFDTGDVAEVFYVVGE
jgi:hypothetical protein